MLGSRGPTPAWDWALISATLQLRLRRLDRRRLMALVIVAVVALIVNGALARARSTVAELGGRTEVAVVTEEVVAGDTLSADQISFEERPTGLVPDRAAEISGLVGRTARSAMVVGEVVVTDRLLPNDSGLEASERAVTVPQPLAPPPLHVGDVVEVIGIEPPDGPFAARSLLLTVGRVLALDDVGVTLATSADDAHAVVAHLATGPIELIITPWSG